MWGSRLQRWSLAVVVAFAIAGLMVVTHQSSLSRRSADFTIDYTAALLIREGHADAIYDRQRLGPLMLQLSGNAIDPHLPFDAPLAMALPYVPLSFLPLETAFHLWQVLTLGLMVFAVGLLSCWFPLGRAAPALGIVALFAFPATWALLSEGQSSGLLLLGSVLLIGAWQRRSWVFAAAGGLLLAMKPQYLPVYLILLVARRDRRALVAAVLATIAVGLSPLIAGGPHGLFAMIWSALEAGQGVIRYNESLIATIGPFLPGPLPTIVAFTVWGLALAALTVIGLRAGARDATAIAVLGTAMGLLFAPHMLPYDAVLLLVPAWLAFDLHARGEIPTPIPVGLGVAAALVVDLGAPLINMTPVVLLAALLIYGYLRRLRLQGQTFPAEQVA
jgi:hypothetical protein